MMRESMSVMHSRLIVRELEILNDLFLKFDLCKIMVPLVRYVYAGKEIDAIYSDPIVSAEILMKPVTEWYDIIKHGFIEDSVSHVCLSYPAINGAGQKAAIICIESRGHSSMVILDLGTLELIAQYYTGQTDTVPSPIAGILGVAH